jgi:hypothetical protein
MEEGAVVRFLTVAGLKVQEIEMELTSVYGYGTPEFCHQEMANAFPAGEDRV